jgi:phytoene dehydrogenase-like protein
MKYDVAVVGAGFAGMYAAAILAKEGMSICLVERSPFLGGRAMSRWYKGHKIMLGAHLSEDPGDGMTRMSEYLGKEIDHGLPNNNLPFWDKDHWVPIQTFYKNTNRADLMKCITALLDTPWEDLERWDHAPLREWMAQYTKDEGVYLVWETVSMLEQLTDRWYDHSASDNLFVRKMHYTTRNMAGYSFWPTGGFDKIFNDLADALRENGGELRLSTPVDKVVVEAGAVKGLRLLDKASRKEGEFIEADQVIVTASVWNVLDLFEPEALPWDVAERIRLLAQKRNRVAWLGYYIAAKEPVVTLSDRELGAWFHTPRAGLSGFYLCQTAFDPSVSPEGEYLHVTGAAFDPVHLGDRAWMKRKWEEFWLDLEEMHPNLKRALIWKKPHLVSTFGVLCKPGLVGATRPTNQVYSVDGLWLAGDSYRARGIGVDKAARSGLTAAEGVLGRRLPFFAETWRY